MSIHNLGDFEENREEGVTVHTQCRLVKFFQGYLNCYEEVKDIICGQEVLSRQYDGNRKTGE